MVSGVFDVMSHLMEQYFSGDDDNTTDYVIEAVMKSLITSSRIAVKNPEDYEARSNIMWCSALGLNSVTGLSKTQDWEVHNIEHQLGATEDMLPKIAETTYEGGGYKYMTHEDILNVLMACFYQLAKHSD